MRFLEICLLGFLAIAEANPLDSNLAYRSPFGDHPQVSTHFFDKLSQALMGRSYCPSVQFARDTKAIHARNVQNIKRNLAKRQVEDATQFNDEHYPTFYGADFSNVCFSSRTKSLMAFTFNFRALSYGAVE